MSTKRGKSSNAALLVAAGMMAAACTTTSLKDMPEPLIIQEQGSFAAGGTVITDPGGRTLHGDHAYAFYQIPAGARKYPLVLWHGAGQFSKTWETTPDEQTWFNQFRIGIWPEYFPGVQFSRDPEALNQYFRQMTPNTGPFDMEVISDAGAALFARTGPAILVTHSQGGGPGWLIAMKSPNVRAVVAYEPGSNFMFPEGEVPTPMKSAGDTLEALGVPLSRFMQLTKIPIVIYYGDNIPDKPVVAPNQDSWRTRLAMARLWAEAVNRRGGNASVVHLPDIGIRGNTHFAFSDLNNLQVADELSRFLREKGLD